MDETDDAVIDMLLDKNVRTGNPRTFTKAQLLTRVFQLEEEVRALREADEWGDERTLLRTVAVAALDLKSAENRRPPQSELDQARAKLWGSIEAYWASGLSRPDERSVTT